MPGKVILLTEGSIALQLTPEARKSIGEYFLSVDWGAEINKVIACEIRDGEIVRVLDYVPSIPVPIEEIVTIKRASGPRDRERHHDVTGFYERGRRR